MDMAGAPGAANTDHAARLTHRLKANADINISNAADTRTTLNAAKKCLDKWVHYTRYSTQALKHFTTILRLLAGRKMK
jgi:hypothetical protein